MNTEKYFLKLAESIASASKDPSTKVGAVIIRPDRSIVSTGYNGFPRQMKDLPDRYNDKEDKLSRIIHAEMNALLFAKEELKECTLYSWPFLTCDRCAVHVIQSGIIRVVAPVCPPELTDRWGKYHQKAKDYYLECGVIVTEL